MATLAASSIWRYCVTPSAFAHGAGCAVRRLGIGAILVDLQFRLGLAEQVAGLVAVLEAQGLAEGGDGLAVVIAAVRGQAILAVA
jgi:hypothetical protein